jgi:hypothetical protein
MQADELSVGSVMNEHELFQVSSQVDALMHGTDVRSFAIVSVLFTHRATIYCYAVTISQGQLYIDANYDTY